MKRTDTLGIISIVLAVLAAPIGLIVSIIALVRNKTRNKSIVLPIIGIIVSIILLPALIMAVGTITYFIASSGETSQDITPETRTEALSGMTIAECLTTNDVVMYGSDGCPACRNQKTVFDDWASIEYIECDKTPDACRDAGIRSIPTWVRGDERLVGMKSLTELASFGGCEDFA